MIVFNNAMKPWMLDRLTQTGTLDDLLDQLRLRLFKSSVTPTGATTLATLDGAECDFPGYTEFSAISWAVAFLNADDRAEATAGAYDFVRTSSSGGAQSVYGYYTVLDDMSDWVFAEQLEGGPEPIDTAGQHFAMNLRLLLDDLIIL